MDSDDEDAQMRQMMGFASFGNKKRKPNHGQQKNAPPNSAATSSNSTPLGQRSTMPPDPLSFVPASLPPRPPPPPATGASDVIGPEPDEATVKNTSSAEQHQVGNEDDSSTPSVPFDAQAPSFEPTHPDEPTTTTTETTTVFSKNDIRSDPTYWNTMNDRQSQDNAIAYTSPWTGVEMTQKELREYAVGKRVLQPNGEMELTFFKPSFVAEGLWDRWEKGEAGKEGQGGDETRA